MQTEIEGAHEAKPWTKRSRHYGASRGLYPQLAGQRHLKMTEANGKSIEVSKTSTSIKIDQTKEKKEKGMRNGEKGQEVE